MLRNCILETRAPPKAKAITPSRARRPQHAAETAACPRAANATCRTPITPRGAVRGQQVQERGGGVQRPGLGLPTNGAPHSRCGFQSGILLEKLAALEGEVENKVKAEVAEIHGPPPPPPHSSGQKQAAASRARKRAAPRQVARRAAISGRRGRARAIVTRARGCQAKGGPKMPTGDETAVAIIGGTGVEQFGLDTPPEEALVTTPGGRRPPCPGAARAPDGFPGPPRRRAPPAAAPPSPYRANIAALRDPGRARGAGDHGRGRPAPRPAPRRLRAARRLHRLDAARPEATFFDEPGQVVHTDFTTAYSPAVRAAVLEAAAA